MSEQAVLLVTSGSGDDWSRVVTRALGSDWRLDLSQATELDEYLAAHHYRLVILDAPSLQDAQEVVLRVMRHDAQLPVIVASASPNWRQAARVLKIGAADYIYKTLDERELQPQLREAMSLAPGNGAE
jgi:DNA-binding response OmpR family regulator